MRCSMEAVEPGCLLKRNNVGHGTFSRQGLMTSFVIQGATVSLVDVIASPLPLVVVTVMFRLF